MLSIAHIHPLTSNFAVNTRGEHPEVRLSRPRHAHKGSGSLLSRMVRPVYVWYCRHKLMGLLDSLDDRMLSDIGVRRCDILAVVAGAYPWASARDDAGRKAVPVQTDVSALKPANDQRKSPLAA